MATGTGKTYTAFQIIWRLWKAGRKKRILFLADRNVLVDQTMVNDFRPFGQAMAKLSVNSKTIEREDGTEIKLPTAVDKKTRRIDTSYKIYLSLYQSITGPEERQKLFKELSPDFFDLIVIDECHRGSASEDSAWREILDHFSEATHIGLTATPKETEYVSNIHYFGDPVYTYSLRQGISDGFLAPYKVIKVHIDKDVEGYRPEKGQVDRDGNFIDPESKYPVIVTTSRLLSTGVDAQTCRLIVLEREVGSMTEFKQIVGRGTRVHEDTDKYYFTLVDFRKATNHFADPDFDGDPVQIYEPGEDDPMDPPEEDTDTPPAEDPGPYNDDEEEEEEEVIHPPLPPGPGSGPREPIKKIYVDGILVKIVAERVEYLDENGKLVTESLKDFTKKALKKHFATLEAFLLHWNSTERKQAIIDELADEGLSLEILAEDVGKDFDPFDLICHIAFDQPPLTRHDRAENVRKRDPFTKYGEQARKVLEALLAKYEDEGVIAIDDPKLLKVAPFSELGLPLQLIKEFGGREDFEAAVHKMQRALYDESAATG